MTLFQTIRQGRLPSRLTVADLYAMTETGALAENENLELIDGEIVPTAAAKASVHERMKSLLTRMLVRSLDDDALLYPEPSITLSDITLVEPDLVVLPASLESRDARGPDLLLVIEIANSSLGYDLRVKAPLYARHGVRDYWVVDAVRKTIRVHRAAEGGSFSDVEEYEAHDDVAALLLPGIAVRLGALD